MKSNPTAVAPGSNPLVLVVDDDAGMREMITTWLTMENIPCVAAGTVDEAKTLLRKEPIAVTLLDWSLDRSGAEVLTACREMHPLMPVIVMSGQPYDVRTDALLKAADGFLAKPMSGTVVVGHVRRWLARLQDAPRIMLPRREEDILPLEEIKSRYIRHVAQLLDNNASLAAKRLGIHRQTVTSVLKTDEAAGATPTPEAAQSRGANQVVAAKRADRVVARRTGQQSRASRKALGLIAVLASLVGASSQAQTLTLEAEDGVITAPFVATNGWISQPVPTGLTDGGRAVYHFTITNKENYAVIAVIQAAPGTSNSFHVNMDGEPVEPQMICDVPAISGIVTNRVSWRETVGSGTGTPQPKFFELDAGEHQMIIRGRSEHLRFDRFMIVPESARPEPPGGFRLVLTP